MPQYYCHRCARSFDLDVSAPIACTRCQGEFVEIVDRPAVFAATMPTGNLPFLQQLGQVMQGLGDGVAARPQNQSEVGQRLQNSLRAAMGFQQEVPLNTNGEPARIDGEPSRAAAGAGPSAAGARRGDDEEGLEQFIHNMFIPAGQRPEGNNMTVSFNFPGGGIQIRHLLDQHADIANTMNELFANFQNAGEANMPGRGFSEADITQYLPMKQVTQKHVDNAAQCTTCFDTFKLGEEVGALDCEHIFHRPCIEPWLKTKDSCPVCRQKIDMGNWKKNHAKVNTDAVLMDLD